MEQSVPVVGPGIGESGGDGRANPDVRLSILASHVSATRRERMGGIYTRRKGWLQSKSWKRNYRKQPLPKMALRRVKELEREAKGGARVKYLSTLFRSVRNLEVEYLVR